jgi:hypothetical protein
MGLATLDLGPEFDGFDGVLIGEDATDPCQ